MSSTMGASVSCTTGLLVPDVSLPETADISSLLSEETMGLLVEGVISDGAVIEGEADSVGSAVA